MSEERAHARPRSLAGCLLRVVLAVAAVIVAVVIIGETFDQGDKAHQPLRRFDAGPAENYQRGDVSFLAGLPVWVVRLQDGTFLALYNRSPKQQEADGSCRASYDETASIGAAEPVPGFSGAFVEDCDGLRTAWRADGTLAFGAGYGNLDRFDTSVNDQGHLIIRLDSRTCTRSRGVIGAPPFVEARCGKPEDI
jgi:hypothetical protein